MVLKDVFQQRNLSRLLHSGINHSGINTILTHYGHGNARNTTATEYLLETGPQSRTASLLKDNFKD